MKLALAAALAVFIPSAVLGQGTNCAARDETVAMLAHDYGETRQSAGLTGAGIIKTYANEETGTFTVILTNVEGVSCMIAAGTDWRKAKSEPEGVKL